ncbi:MAG: metallophosphoesterase family protein [Planctomycetota bacterium]
MSDTHGRPEIAATAVQRLIDAGAKAIAHCGDVGTGHEGRSVLDALVGPVPVWFVWGNTDYDGKELEAYAQALGLHCLSHWGRLPEDVIGDDGPVALHHGHDFRLYDRIIAEQGGGYLLSGHTHVPHDGMENGVRLLNPGALHRARPKTAAMLNLADGDWDLLEIAM